MSKDSGQTSGPHTVKDETPRKKERRTQTLEELFNWTRDLLDPGVPMEA